MRKWPPTKSMLLVLKLLILVRHCSLGSYVDQVPDNSQEHQQTEYSSPGLSKRCRATLSIHIHRMQSLFSNMVTLPMSLQSSFNLSISAQILFVPHCVQQHLLDVRFLIFVDSNMVGLRFFLVRLSLLSGIDSEAEDSARVLFPSTV